MKKYILLPLPKKSASQYVDANGNKFKIIEVPHASPNGFAAQTIEEAIEHYGLVENTVRPVITPKVRVPSEIANWRAKAVLQLHGYLSPLEEQLSQLEGDAGVIARTAWESGAAIVRNSSTVTLITSALGLTAKQVDDLFIEASNLEV